MVRSSLLFNYMSYKITFKEAGIKKSIERRYSDVIELRFTLRVFLPFHIIPNLTFKNYQFGQ